MEKHSMTRRTARSIAEEIELLARLTDAPASFVEQVKRLFQQKAISLEEDVEPFLHALEEAFRREETIRTRSEQIRKYIARARADFDKLEQGCAANLRELERSRETLRRAGQRVRDHGDRLDALAYLYWSNRPPVEEDPDLPMVPGPKDVQ
jgi:DNA repair exonuclease SbcCD ATPase subunit